MNKVYILFIGLILLMACDDKEKRARALKDLDDTQQRLLEVRDEIHRLEQSLTNHIAELEVAKDDFNQVKQFQFLRSETQREQQIRKATTYILNIEKKIDAIKNNITYYQDSVYRTETKIEKLKEYLKN
ncbi:MAG: hypothetical protein EBU52_05360 [Cytophagia bacterium]|nr:hypothetical protein [Cytophagia bacterium]